MGWFGKKKKEGKEGGNPLTLPDLPKLPDFPDLNEHDSEEPYNLHKLPSFPSTPTGNKFSQNTIKDAISGGKEGEDYDADDFDITHEEDEEFEGDQRMHVPLRSPMTREISEHVRRSKDLKPEPVFIRLDKFEEGLHIFDKAKSQILEMEKMLKDIKRIKIKEEQELELWEKEMHTIKAQIDKVDQEVFSKVE